MKSQIHLLVAVAVMAMAATRSASARRLYVALDSPNPTPPFTNWLTAARVIQDAVDAAVAGDEIVVTNGTYAVGGRAVDKTLTNRVAVDKPLTLRSVNGPQDTIIQGAKVPGGGNGEGAIRCVYLADAASVSGFTLTNGATRTASGSDGEENGGGVWCASTNAAVTNCVIAGNSAAYGGGAYGGTLYNCTLTGNLASVGGGASFGTFYNCILTGNSASYGGGAYGGTLYNCTVTGNSASQGGGGVDWNTTLYNCVVYFNRAPVGANYHDATIEYSCAAPLPEGPGNIDTDPQLASATHLSHTSPCIGAGSSAYASGLDIDGEPWASPPAMGADQLVPGQAAGSFSLRIDTDFTSVATGHPVTFTAWSLGPILESRWDFGDGTLLTNQPFATHAWSVPGSFTVQLSGYSDSFPDGVTTSVAVTVSEAVSYYVNPASANPVFPYKSWETAARNIQEAIGAGTLAGRLVLVTNGVYRVGAVETNGLNRVALTKAAVVRSVNGPEVTVIDGANGVRCAYVGDRSVLSGFTLKNGTAQTGAGVRCEFFGTVTNCVLATNSAILYGGGAYGGTLYNCALTGNSAGFSLVVRCHGGGAVGATLYHCTLNDNSVTGPGSFGGGAEECTLYNCTLTGNWAMSGGGVSSGTLYNCTVTGNSALSGGGVSRGTLYNCTLTGNSAVYGGGALFSTLKNCVLRDNSAYARDGGGGDGGGADDCTLYNCTLTGNSAGQWGGGVSRGTLYNCTLTGNSAAEGGGADDCTLYNCTLTGNSAGQWGRGGASGCTLYNCIVYFNNSTRSPNYDNYDFSTLNYCCTFPLPRNGVGNITGPPLFMDMAAGDFRLREGSPCIDAGTNLVGLMIVPIVDPDTWDTSWVPYTYESTDILGNTRFIDGNGDGKVAWDIGAYEFNSFKPPRFNGPPMRTAKCWVFRMTGEPGKQVRLQRTTDFNVWWDLEPPILIGDDGTSAITDANTGPTTMFYRAVVP